MLPRHHDTYPRHSGMGLSVRYETSLPVPVRTVRMVAVMLVLALLPASELHAAHAQAVDQRITVLTDGHPHEGDSDNKVRFATTSGSWPSEYQFVITRQPTHGTVVVQSGINFIYQYDGSDGYTGSDSFEWSLQGSDWQTDTATCRIHLRPAGSNSGNTVLILVNEDLLPEIQSEIERLRSDIENEGSAVMVASQTFSTADALEDYLAAWSSDPAYFAIGCIAIGAFPTKSNSLGDEPYRTVPSGRIWFSRICAPTNGQYGTEVELIKRHLEANHAFRTGAHRMPHFQSFFTGFFLYPEPVDQMGNLTQFWPDYEEDDVTAVTAMARGGSFHHNYGHGNSKSYERGVSGADGMDRAKAMDIGNQINFLLVSACSCGRLGGPVNLQSMTRDGACVLTVGSTPDTTRNHLISRDDAASTAFRSRMQAGDTWGAALASFPNTLEESANIWYGDMSLRINYAASNQMPTLDGLGASPLTVSAGQSVTFTASASDPDGSIAHFRWWPEGFAHGTGLAHRTDTGSFTHVYATPGTYTARVRCYDNYRAFAQKEITIVVQSPSSRVILLERIPGALWAVVEPEDASASDPAADGSQTIAVTPDQTTVITAITTPEADG